METGFKIMSKESDPTATDKTMSFSYRGCERTKQFLNERVLNKHADWKRSTQLSWAKSVHGVARSKVKKSIPPTNEKLAVDKKSYESLYLQFHKEEGNSGLFNAFCKPFQDHNYLFPDSV